MLKRTIQSFLFFSFLQVFLYSCCEPKLYHRKIEAISFMANDNADNDATFVTNENLNLNLNISYLDILIANSFDASSMISTVNATTQCEDDYLMPNKVVEISVVASEPIFGIPAGNSINEKLEYYTYIDSNPNQEFDGLINYLNDIYFGVEDVVLLFNDQITSGTSLAFTISLSLANGNEFVKTTQLIEIE